LFDSFENHYHSRFPMTSKHDEFPPLTPEAELVLRDAEQISDGLPEGIWRRAYLSAAIREAMKQAGPDRLGSCKWDRLGAIADNLHALPPPPPTREQMQTAINDLVRRSNERIGVDLVGDEWVAERLKILKAGIDDHCKVQP
jgi:hypothetical protein